MEKQSGRRWRKYSPEYKQRAVERMKAGEGVTAVARDLGIRRKFLYAWRDEGYGGTGGLKKLLAQVPPEGEEVLERENQALKRSLAELERLLGRQAGELDFFAAALRSVEELRPNKSNSSGDESTPPSNALRKANPR